MKKLICFLFGHNWFEVDRKDLDRYYLTWTFNICSRCGVEDIL